MRAVLQRVTSASVAVDQEIVGKIEKGLLVLLGVESGDTDADLDYVVEKLAVLRIFEDDGGKMNRSVQDVGGGILLVSQFTLCADVRKGRRPGFDQAARPEEAESQYRACADKLRARGIPIEMGVFGADMAVALVNDGPVTIILDSRKRI